MRPPLAQNLTSRFFLYHGPVKGSWILLWLVQCSLSLLWQSLSPRSGGPSLSSSLQTKFQSDLGPGQTLWKATYFNKSYGINLDFLGVYDLPNLSLLLERVQKKISQ